MSSRPLPAATILAAGVGMGLAGDYLLRSPGEPGLNFTLLFAGLALSIVSITRSGGGHLEREASAWLGVGLLFGAALLWRGSGLVRFLAFVAASTAFAIPALHAGRAWARKAGVTDLVEAIAASGLHAGLGSVRLFQRESWEAVGSEDSRSAARAVARSGLMGVLLAAVPLMVFGALFMSADQVFAGIVQDLVRVDLQTLASHVVLTTVLSWLACGYLAGFWSGTRLDGIRGMGWVRPSLKVAEVATALGLVDLLFLGFVAVQFRYLFGGSAWVEVTPGLGYAAYARAGFFQLVAATALGLPWLLAADGLLGKRGGPARWIFRGLAGVQLVLLLAIVASAVQRMRAYLDAYGLTEDRFVASAVLGWLALVVLWFGATVLRGNRRPFAFGTLVSAFVLVAALQVANPAARAASSHLARAGLGVSGPTAPGDSGLAPAVDAQYLASLGADATPLLVEHLAELDGPGRCVVARKLMARWGPEQPADWRSWNQAEQRARQVVRSELVRLREAAGSGEECG